MTEIRWSRPDDADGLAALHREAWRNAYAGIIPGLALERMLAARGPSWWRRMDRRGMRALVLDLGNAFEGPGPAGYATLGRYRLSDSAMGEVYELYLRPEAQGIGFGRQLFHAARGELRNHGLSRLHVWALADNVTGCRFYAAMGGKPATRSRQRIGDRDLDKIGFRWE